MFAHGKTATIVRQVPGGTDEYGDPIPGTTIRVDVPGCGWAPRSAGAGPSSEDIHDRGRQGVIVGLTLYMPAGTDLRHTDQVELEGLLYDVEGDPGEWRNPLSGREAGLEVALRRAEG